MSDDVTPEQIIAAALLQRGMAPNEATALLDAEAIIYRLDVAGFVVSQPDGTVAA